MTKPRRTRKLLRLRKKEQTIGAPPGLLIADPESPAPEIHVLAYTGDELLEEKLENPSQIVEIRDKYAMIWVDIRGLGDPDVLREVGEIFGIHKLALEDVLNKLQRPKTEEFEDQIYTLQRILNKDIYPHTEQLNIFFSGQFVVTFLDRDGRELEPVKERIRKKSGKIRQLGADYIAYAIMDAVIDAYYPVFEEIGETLEAIEMEIIHKPEISSIKRLHELKRNLLELRRAIWPLRESINRLIRSEIPVITDFTTVYLRDCYDHAIQLIDIIEYFREVCSDLINMYLSSISNKTNDVMKVLTIIATIFIPLTFLAGIYGMNFSTDASPWNMPELNYPFAYPIFWLVTIVVGLGLVLAFKRIGWLGPSK